MRKRRLKGGNSTDVCVPGSPPEVGKALNSLQGRQPELPISLSFGFSYNQQRAAGQGWDILRLEKMA